VSVGKEDVPPILAFFLALDDLCDSLRSCEDLFGFDQVQLPVLVDETAHAVFSQWPVGIVFGETGEFLAVEYSSGSALCHSVEEMSSDGIEDGGELVVEPPFLQEDNVG